MTTKEKTMTTSEVAKRFNELAREGKFDQILDELYDEMLKALNPLTQPGSQFRALKR
jgi:hypothetical protein